MTVIRTTADVMTVLKQRIADLGLTRLDVDHRAGLAEGHTSRILCGRKKPQVETMLRLYAALELGLLPVVVDEDEKSTLDSTEGDLAP